MFPYPKKGDKKDDNAKKAIKIIEDNLDYAKKYFITDENRIFRGFIIIFDNMFLMYFKGIAKLKINGVEYDVTSLVGSIIDEMKDEFEEACFA